MQAGNAKKDEKSPKTPKTDGRADTAALPQGGKQPKRSRIRGEDGSRRKAEYGGKTVESIAE